MVITSARLQGEELILTLANPAEGAKTAYKFNAGEYELVKAKKKRSLDANAYCWVLIHKIAEKVHEPPVEVYRTYIRDIGCKTMWFVSRPKTWKPRLKPFCMATLDAWFRLAKASSPVVPPL